MRLTVFLLGGWLASFVYADGISTCYQRVWIWYAYQVDSDSIINANSTAPRSTQVVSIDRIVPSCAGKDCTFTQLMNAIDGDSQPDLGIDFDLKDVTPDANKLARRLYDYGYTSRPKPRNVISSATGTADMIEKVGSSMNLRARLGERWSVEWRPLEPYVLVAQVSLEMERGYANLQHSMAFTQAVRKNMPGVKVQTVPGIVGEVFSLEETVNAVPEASREQVKTDLTKFFDAFPRPQDTVDTGYSGSKAGSIASLDVASNEQRGVSCDP